MIHAVIQRFETTRFSQIFTAVLPLPLVILGFVLPLDFFHEIDSYKMFLRPLEIANAFAYATVIYLLLALAITLPAIIGVWIVSRITGWARTSALRNVVAAVSGTILLLVLIRNIKLWLMSLDITPPISLSAYAIWLIPLTAGISMFVVYRNQNMVTGVLRWLTFNTILVISVGAVCALAYPVDALFQSGHADAPVLPLADSAVVSTRPNIVLITIDTFSASHSSVYGYGRDTTPNLKQLAGNASTFTNFYANSNRTLPGIGSILYGVRPWTHRAFGAGDPSSAQAGLVAQLKESGYTTFAATSNPVASPLLTLTDTYFDKSIDCAIRMTPGECLLLQLNHPAAIPVSALASYKRGGDVLAALMVRLGFWSLTDHFEPDLVFSPAKDMVLQRPVDRPFFLWVHLFAPHDPYAAPEPFLGHFDSTALHRTRFDSSPPLQFSAAEDPTFPDAYTGRYDESLLYVDDHIGKFFAWLKHHQQYDQSLILVSSDHGESFSRGYGNHGGALLHNDLIQIPLFIKQPYQEHAEMINAFAEQIDLAPTILDLAGIAVPGMFEGKSLKPILEKQVEGFDRPVFSMNFEMEGRFGSLRYGSFAMIDRGWKFVTYRGYQASASLPELRDELYNLAADPGEKYNLIGQRPDLAATMNAAIDRQLQMHSQLPE